MRVGQEQEQVEMDPVGGRKGLRARPEAHLGPGAGAEGHQQLQVQRHLLGDVPGVGPQVQVAPVGYGGQRLAANVVQRGEAHLVHVVLIEATGSEGAPELLLDESVEKNYLL